MENLLQESNSSDNEFVRIVRHAVRQEQTLRELEELKKDRRRDRKRPIHGTD